MGRKLLDSAYTLKPELTAFADALMYSVRRSPQE